MAAVFNFKDSAGKRADTKRLDCFIKSDQKSCPRIVVEVGYSETFEKLVEDAHRWLRGSNLVHRVLLVNVDKKDKYQLFKKIVESKERDETPDKTNLWTEYQRVLARNVPQYPKSAYCGRRSLLYSLSTEE
jgi:hypothetical protein